MINATQVTKPVVNPTPKQLLAANKELLSRHRDFMQNPYLSQTIDMAMAQYVRVLAEKQAMDGNTAAANFFKIEGAHDFVNTLRRLGETPELPAQSTKNNLDYSK